MIKKHKETQIIHIILFTSDLLNDETSLKGGGVGGTTAMKLKPNNKINNTFKWLMKELSRKGVCYNVLQPEPLIRL